MKRQGVFPFTAIIGQEEMKKALILNVVNPRLGGVLIQGEKRDCQIYCCPCIGGFITAAGMYSRMPLS